MKRHVSNLRDINEAAERVLLQRPRLSVAVLGAMLVLCEAVVLWRFPLLGVGLVVASGGLAFVAIRSRASQLAAASVGAPESVAEPVCGLPNRQHLIEQLAREMARSQRYSQPLTLAVISVSQHDEVRAAWGEDTAGKAVIHVAETLDRVTRSSDYVAALGDGRFAVILVECDEANGANYADRASHAVSNRPLRSTTSLRVPLYVAIDVKLTQYHDGRYRGPLEWLSAAGGDVTVEPPTGSRGRALANDPQALRRQLVRDYYPDGEMSTFAEAYREQRNRARQTG